MPLARAAYRTGQFLQALFARLPDDALDSARALLNEGEMRLFLSMEKRDQLHGLRVMEEVARAGETDGELLAAALLHDCGKGKVPVWLRVAYVVAPGAVESLGRGGREGGSSRGRALGFSGARAAAYRLVNHAQIGSELAERAGSNRSTVRYISGGGGEHERAKIALLRSADDRS